MIDPVALQIVLSVLTGWLDRRKREAVAYLIEEDRLPRRQLNGRPLRLTDDDRRRLADKHIESAVRRWVNVPHRDSGHVAAVASSNDEWTHPQIPMRRSPR